MQKKITDHDHDKYIATSEFKLLTARVFTARFAQANLVAKTNFSDYLRSLNKKNISNKAKNVLVEMN